MSKHNDPVRKMLDKWSRSLLPTTIVSRYDVDSLEQRIKRLIRREKIGMKAIRAWAVYYNCIGHSAIGTEAAFGPNSGEINRLRQLEIYRGKPKPGAINAEVARVEIRRVTSTRSRTSKLRKDTHGTGNRG